MYVEIAYQKNNNRWLIMSDNIDSKLDIYGGSDRELVVSSEKAARIGTVANSINKELITSLDDNVEELRTALTTEIQEDKEQVQNAQKALASILDDYTSIASDMDAQNRKAKKVYMDVDSIKKSETAGEAVKGISRLIGTVTDKIPIVKGIKSKIKESVRESPNLSHVLDEQLRVTTSLKDRLSGLLFNEKDGLATISAKLHKSVVDYNQELIDLKVSYDKSEKEIAFLQNERNDIYSSLTPKYGEEINSIDLMALSPDETMIYQKVSKMDMSLFTMEQVLYKSKNRMKVVTDFINGKRTTLSAVGIAHIQGQDIYERVENILNEANEDIGAVSRLAEYEEVLVNAASMIHQLSSNYNKIMETMSEHALVMAEHGKNIVPNQLNDPQTLVRSMENIAKAAKKMILNDPLGTSQHLSKYLGNLANQGELVQETSTGYKKSEMRMG